MEIKKAQRKRAKLRIGLSWPSGSWKTMSALKLAKGLVGDWTKVCLIDTENWSGELYSDLWEYNVITITDFRPSTYIEAIKAAESAWMEAIIIDSITHEWKYILEAVDKITQASAAKNSYTAWAKATPQHDAFIQAILQSPAHMITTVRSKQDYDMSKNSEGKTIVKKVGMKQETRDWFEYELTVSFDIDITHTAVASKDRTNLFNGELGFTINEDLGLKLKKWNESGAKEIEKKKDISEMPY